MPKVRDRLYLIGIVLIFAGWQRPLEASPACSPCEEAISRALKLLPRQPERVVVFDDEGTTALVRAKVAHADAFVTTGERVVYVRKQGLALRRALSGHAFFDHVLAGVIWHEMAHVEGAAEAAAQQAEETLWRQFIVARRIATDRGMEYLALLRKRHE